MTCLKPNALVATLVFLLLIPTSVLAHPHILATLHLKLIYNDDGSSSALRQSWRYDPAYSALALRQADDDRDGSISNTELQAFAAKQSAALAGFHYYTSVKVNDKDVALAAATDVSVDKDEFGVLTLHFSLPLKLAAENAKKLAIEVFDPQFLAYFSLQSERGATLANAPAACNLTYTGPAPIDLKNTRSVPAAFWAALDGSAAAGHQFINRINVSCP